MMSRWDTTCQQLPTIVSRLQSLRALHENASQFSDSLTQLETHQSQATKVLKENNDLMGKLEKNLEKNLSTVQSNFTAIEKRIGDISKKLEELGLETF